MFRLLNLVGQLLLRPRNMLRRDPIVLIRYGRNNISPRVQPTVECHHLLRRMHGKRAWRMTKEEVGRHYDKHNKAIIGTIDLVCKVLLNMRMTLVSTTTEIVPTNVIDRIGRVLYKEINLDIHGEWGEFWGVNFISYPPLLLFCRLCGIMSLF